MYRNLCRTSEVRIFVIHKSIRSPLLSKRWCSGNANDQIDPFGVIPILPRIEQITKTQLSRPRYIAVGDQSSGKSSLLEAIIGLEIFPKGNSMVTRRPLSLVLEKVETGFWVEFADGLKIYNIEDVKNRILAENLAIGAQDISDEPIHVKVCSKDVHNLSVTDLPGLINIAGQGQDKLLPKKIKALVKPYIDDPNNIPIVVLSATEDPANSNGLREVNRGNASNRSLGVVTKIDLKKEFSETIQTLKNENYYLGFGYFGAILRGNHQLTEGVSLQEMQEIERKFYIGSGLSAIPQIRMGLPLIKQQLSRILLQRIAPQLPNIIQQLDKLIINLEEKESFLSRLANEPDLTTVAKDLETLVTRLHPEASTRINFEKQLRDKLIELVKGMVTVYRNRYFSNFKPSQMIDDFKDKLDLVDPNLEKTVFNCSESVLKEYGSITGFSQTQNLDRLTRMFIFGDNAPEQVTNRVTQKLKKQFIEQGLFLSYFNIITPDDMNRTRIDWHQRLSNFINEMIDPENSASIQNAAYSLMMNELHLFVNNIEINHKDLKKTNLARQFSKYLFDKIGNMIFNTKLRSSISHHINAEKRMVVDLHKLGYEFSKILGHPSSFHSFINRNTPISLLMFDQVWTEAYFNVFAERVADNLFRTFGVNLLDPLIGEAIQYSLKTFRGDKISLEAQTQGQQLEELRNYRQVLVKANTMYKGNAETPVKDT